MTVISALKEVQIPLLAMVLLAGSLAKVARAVRVRSLEPAFGPQALFPVRLRRSAAIGLCIVEFSFGVLLILTASMTWHDAAMSVRVGAALLFAVATLALIELRTSRPDRGSVSFGVFSTTITGRMIVRSALLTAAALATLWVQPIDVSHLPARASLLAGLGGAELVILALLSPEIRAVLVIFGYSAPCELRAVSAEQTLAALGRSPQWRKHSGLIAPGEQPADIWRELCWGYVVYPSTYADKEAQVVFAVHLQHRRPAVLSVLLDTATGAALPWPSTAGRATKSWRPRRTYRGVTGTALTPGDAPGTASSAAH